MDASAEALCPRCGGAFHCGANDAGPGPCPCTTVTLDAAVLAGLRRLYTGCVCLRCLRCLAELAAKGPASGLGPP